MIKDLFRKISKRWKWIALAIVILLVIASATFILSSFSKNNAVPAEFLTARDAGSKYSQEIVSDLQNISSNLPQVQKFENENKSSDALNLLMLQVKTNEDARAKAVSLTSELEKMTQAIPSITPDKASQSALIALSSETMLIQKLIAYNELLNTLLLLVRDQILNHVQNSKQINDTIDQINSATEEINKINIQFLDEMKNFDSYF